jgi:hypothetical protein
MASPRHSTKFNAQQAASLARARQGGWLSLIPAARACAPTFHPAGKCPSGRRADLDSDGFQRSTQMILDLAVLGDEQLAGRQQQWKDSLFSTGKDVHNQLHHRLFYAAAISAHSSWHVDNGFIERQVSMSALFRSISSTKSGSESITNFSSFRLRETSDTSHFLGKLFCAGFDIDNLANKSSEICQRRAP